jgi:hypothetical protein
MFRDDTLLVTASDIEVDVTPADHDFGGAVLAIAFSVGGRERVLHIGLSDWRNWHREVEAAVRDAGLHLRLVR